MEEQLLKGHQHISSKFLARSIVNGATLTSYLCRFRTVGTVIRAHCLQLLCFRCSYHVPCVASEVGGKWSRRMGVQWGLPKNKRH